MKLFFLIVFVNFLFFVGLNAQEKYKPLRAVDLRIKKKSLNGLSPLKSVSLNQGQYDARYYKLELSIDFNRGMIAGKLSARFTVLNDSLSAIALDLDRNMFVDSVGLDAADFNRIGQNIILELKRAYTSGENINVSVNYRGRPADNGWFSFDLMPGEGTPMASTLSEPYGASYWWPCKDTPADKADSLDILLTVPQGYFAASNGTLVSQRENNDGSVTFHWHEKYPIATYLVSLVAGTYYHFTDYYHYSGNDSMLLDYYVYPKNAEAADTVFARVPDYLDALSHYFGAYPFIEEKYGMAQFNWGGGMEHQTLTSIGYVASVWEYIYVHELGHQWFGDQITCASWRDIWLNEGFASYSEPLYAEWAGFAGYPPGMDAYHAYMSTQKYFDSGTIIREDTLNIGSLFDRIVYDKGSWVLHMLRHITGDKVFFDILKSYLNDPRWTYGSVRTENFIEICERKSGLNLTKFFDQWLNYEYYPKYEFGWNVETKGIGQYEVNVVIAQTQGDPNYEMPVDLTFGFNSAADTTVTVYNNSEYQLYKIILPHRPVRAWLDKDDWILKSVNELPFKKEGVELEIENVYPSPFTQDLTIKVFNWTQKRHKLDIFNNLGQKIRTISEYEMENNFSFISHWDGKNDNGDRVASGIYFIRLYTQSDGINKNGNTKKIIYLR